MKMTVYSIPATEEQKQWRERLAKETCPVCGEQFGYRKLVKAGGQWVHKGCRDFTEWAEHQRCFNCKVDLYKKGEHINYVDGVSFCDYCYTDLQASAAEQAERSAGWDPTP